MSITPERLRAEVMADMDLDPADGEDLVAAEAADRTVTVLVQHGIIERATVPLAESSGDVVQGQVVDQAAFDRVLVDRARAAVERQERRIEPGR